MKKYLIIHGHFYQPPRENPWIAEIERQDGAFPYHDFNEKIDAECYTPNAFSKYLDGFGRILDIVNNYDFLDFNFGPTLMGWIKNKNKDTYNKIVEGDRESCKRLEGHGNAIAQVYNHVIMPLADKKRKEIQVKWAIKDFKRHFDRDPEGMWLAETAIDIETVKVLIDNNIKFTILSPYQALKFREIGSQMWNDVSQGTISPSRPYRIFDYDKNGKRIEDRYLDVFFFDRILSPAVSFEHLMRDSQVFLDRIVQAGEHIGNEEIVNISTDGETFGHHEPFANMCLTALSKKLKDSEYEWVNYSWYLAKYPPKDEVILKKGDYGTAWSCSHGVGRWYRDCGCTTDSPDYWNQKWRTPLRDAFNHLQKKADDIFLETFNDLTDDPWTMFERSMDITDHEGDVNELLKINADKDFDEIKIRNILLMQKYVMFCFTSCGWFFGDISRIEPVQNLKYAKKALDIMKMYDKEEAVLLEKEMLLILRNAISNIPSQKNGEHIWKNSVVPAKISDDKFAAFFMINLLVTDDKEDISIFNRLIASTSEVKEIQKNENIKKIIMNIKVKNEELNMENEYSVFGIIDRPHTLEAYVCKKDYDKIEILVEKFASEDFSKYFKEQKISYFGLEQMFYDQKEFLAKRLFENIEKNISEKYRIIYDENIQNIRTMLGIGIEPPYFLIPPISLTLKEDITRLFESFCENNSKELYEKIIDDSLLFKRINTQHDDFLEVLFERKISEKFSVYFKSDDLSILDNIMELFRLSWDIDITLGLDREKNMVFSRLREYMKEKELLIKEDRLSEMDFNGILKVVNIAEALNMNIDELINSLNPFKK